MAELTLFDYLFAVVAIAILFFLFEPIMKIMAMIKEYGWEETEERLSNSDIEAKTEDPGVFPLPLSLEATQ